MTRRRWVPLLLLAGAAALVHNAVYLSSELSGPAPAMEEPEEEEAEEEPDEEEQPGARWLEPIRAEEVRAYLASLPEAPRNPFMTRLEADGEVRPVVSGVPRVTGTLFSDGRRVAWIDGFPRSEGELVRGFQLERIGPGRVVMTQGGERLELPVEPLERLERTSEESLHEE